MKRFATFIILTFLFLNFFSLSQESEKAQDIIEKMVEAQGGTKLLKSIKDMTITGTFELIQDGMTGPLTFYKKEPDKRRVDIELMGMVITQAYDGTIAWWINPQTGAVEEMNEQQTAEAKRQALPMASILEPEKYGLSFTYKGKEQIENKDYFVLEQTYPDGFKATLYIDAETYLLYKSKSTTVGPYGNEIENEEISSDYKKIGGMVFPHLITTYNDGQEYSIITIEEATFNTGLEDSLFKMSK